MSETVELKDGVNSSVTMSDGVSDGVEISCEGLGEGG